MNHTPENDKSQNLETPWPGRLYTSLLFEAQTDVVQAISRAMNGDWETARWHIEDAQRQLERAVAEIKEAEEIVGRAQLREAGG